MTGDHQNGRVRVLGADRLQRLQSVHPRHLDVEKDGVRSVTADRLDPVRTRGGLQTLVLFVLEDHPQRLADVLLVVDDQDLVFHGTPGFMTARVIAWPPDFSP